MILSGCTVCCTGLFAGLFARQQKAKEDYFGLLIFIITIMIFSILSGNHGENLYCHLPLIQRSYTMMLVCERAEL